MLNRSFTIINVLILIIIASCKGEPKNQQWIDNLPKPWLLSEAEVSNILPEFHKRFPNFEGRLKAIALWRIGTPYGLFMLGEEMPPDTDPIIRLDVSDCTVHVVTTLSFTQSKTWNEAREKLIKIHYKTDEDGNQIPTYRARWHFTSDRIISNPNTVNITNEYVDPSELVNIDLILNVKEDNSELLELAWSKNIQLSYIPNSRIDLELLGKLPRVCGIAFVRTSYFKDGLAIAHEGILIDNKDLIHSSSLAHETAKVNFINYYFGENNPAFDGILIYKFVPFD